MPFNKSEMFMFPQICVYSQNNNLLKFVLPTWAGIFLSTWMYLCHTSGVKLYGYIIN